jgi:Asp-tRNA(Asn)/Glu-tRNA(Gln) amidotransferase A subunit family amidase
LREALALPVASEENILRLSLAQIVDSCRVGETSPSAVRDVFLRQTLKAHAATNCIAEFLPDNSATSQEKDARPLLGVPISIKDACDYEGTDTTLGYSCNVNKPASSHSVITRMLLDAGATLHVKTTVPTGLVALETDSDLYGYCCNPYNPGFASGASTGGGGALLAYGGSKIEIGSDFGGSIRLPAHFNGLYSIRASHGRFPETGVVSYCPGLQGIYLVTSPMAQNLEDLTEFCHRFVDLKPWKECHTVGRFPDLNPGRPVLRIHTSVRSCSLAPCRTRRCWGSEAAVWGSAVRWDHDRDTGVQTGSTTRRGCSEETRT